MAEIDDVLRAERARWPEHGAAEARIGAGLAVVRGDEVRVRCRLEFADGRIAWADTGGFSGLVDLAAYREDAALKAAAFLASGVPVEWEVER